MTTFFSRISGAIAALVCSQTLLAQVDFHTEAVQISENQDITIDEPFAPFGNRPETDKSGDDGSFVIRDRNGVMIWITRDGTANVLPDSTLAKALFVSNSECIIFENRFQSAGAVFDTPDFDSVLAIHRLAPDGSLSTRRATFVDQTFVDTINITPTTYGYNIVTANYLDDGEEGETVSALDVEPVNQWAARTITLYRLTWTSTTGATGLDVQYLTSEEFPVSRDQSAIGETSRAFAFGNDGAFVLNLEVAKTFDINTLLGQFFDTALISVLFTYNLDQERVQILTNTQDFDELEFRTGVFVDNSRTVVSQPEVNIIGVDTNFLPVLGETGDFILKDFRTNPNNGNTLLNAEYTLGPLELVLPVGTYFREGFPIYYYTLVNNQTEIQLNLLRNGIEPLGASVPLPNLVLDGAPIARNSRDGSLLVRGEGTAGLLWLPTTVGADGIATGIESLRAIPNSTQSNPLHVSSNEAVVWMNADAPVDISNGAEIPPANIQHVRADGAGVLLTKLNIEGRYVATPPRISYDPVSEGWNIATFEKQRLDPKTAVMRYYRLFLGGGVDSDGDGLSDVEERTIFFTDPENPDTDGDGLSDGQEVRPYTLATGLFTWEEARLDAIRRGGKLADLRNQTKRDALDYFLGSAIRQRVDRAWIGGNDVGKEGVYRWLTRTGRPNGKKLNSDPDAASNNWERPFHPNNLFNADGMVVIANQDLSWAMLPVEEQFPYIMEFPVSDPLTPDTDGDGLTDAEERNIGSDPNVFDTDGDGLSDSEEQQAGSNPNVKDTDGDGLDDFEEVRTYRTDPTSVDTDGDGLEDGEEITRGTDPRKRDTDGDGLFDGDEITERTDPLNPDTDGDGLTDGAEINLGTDPVDPDTDNDGIKDGDEIDRGSDPLDRRDPRRLDNDKDGLSNYEELFVYGTDPDDKDSDNDGLTDFDEVKRGTDPNRKDTDRDGLTDSTEVEVTFTNPKKSSTGAASPDPGKIPFNSSRVQGDYEGIVTKRNGSLAFKQSLRISSGRSFTSQLLGLNSRTSFKGKFSKKGVFVGKPGKNNDLRRVRMVVTELSKNNYVVQGTYQSKKGGEFHFQLRKAMRSKKSAGNQRVSFSSTWGRGSGPKGAIVGTGNYTNRSGLNLNIYMPDGSRSSFNGPVLKNKVVALYARSGKGSNAVVVGSLKVRKQKGKSDFDGPVRIKSPGSRNGNQFPSGYDQQRTIRGAYYRPPSFNSLPLSGFKNRNDNALFRWMGGSFGGVKKVGTWTGSGKMNIPTGQFDSARTSFQSNIGLLKMTYRRTDPSMGLVDANSHVVAVVQQRQDSFRGSYTGNGSAARFMVVPNKGKEKPDITVVTPKSKEVAAAASTYTVTVKSGEAWTVEIPADAPWVTATITSGGTTGPSDSTTGSGDGLVTVTVEQNATFSRRKTTLKIAGFDHHLTQEFR